MHKLYYLIFLLAVFINGCMHNVEKHPLLNTYCLLSDEKLSENIALANKGSGEAAYKIWEHYIIGGAKGEDGIVIGEKYFDMAVNFKYPPALFSKGIRIWHDGKGDPNLALFYIKESKDLGLNCDYIEEVINEIESAIKANKTK